MYAASLLLLALAALAAPNVVTAAACKRAKRAAPSAAADTQCIQVQVVYRHGARTIVTPTYPTDPNADPKLYQPYGLGHLTSLGRQHEYVLGQLLRSRYVGATASVANLLDAEYASGVLTTKTSGVARTQESAASCLAGMWPPAAGSRQRWHSNNTQVGQVWTPIVYDIIPFAQDRAIAGTAPCASRDLEYNRVVTSGEYRTRVLRVLGGEANLRYLETNSGTNYNFSDPASAAFAYNIFSATQCQELLGLTTPSWIKKLYPEPLRAASTLYLRTLSYTPKLMRHSYGDLTKWLMNATRNYETQPKFQAYSGHDATVSAVIQIFELEPQDDAGFGIPDFSACVMIELHRDRQGRLGLRFFYRREYGGKVITMVPKGCNEFCLLDDVEEILSNKMSRDDETCDVPADHGTTLREVHRAHILGHHILADPTTPSTPTEETD
ncbi:testicular acid phosphatase homolog [Thrips palmi]|uniref:2-phosphoxylose phosphatase 1 n=1 Tax=Thrips palmi TaxID=161013 RepID=A0A6P8ZPS5_THRPL|nr:testicular acid phosphatase homolog [Thrips palmi]